MKFLDSYEKNDIRMWALSTGNEPSNAYTFKNSNITMGWTPETMANWIANNLGPTLTSSRFHHTKIMAFDDDRSTLTTFIEPLLMPENSGQYIAGVGVHWYQDNTTRATVLDQTHNDYPEKFIMMTEASNGEFFMIFNNFLYARKRTCYTNICLVQYVQYGILRTLHRNHGYEVKNTF